MSETPAAGPTFTAAGVVTVGDRKLASEPFVFDMAGIHLILQNVPGGDGFEVIRGNNPQPGLGRFEKTCMQPVTFLVTRDGKPYWKVEVKGMFDSMKLELIAE